MTQSQQNNDKKLYQTLKAIRKSLLNQPRNIDLIFKKGYVLYLLKKYKLAADAFSHAIVSTFYVPYSLQFMLHLIDMVCIHTGAASC